MNAAQVKEKLALFLKLTRQEQELRDHLETLSYADAEEHEVSGAMSRQAEVMRELRELREQQVLPLMEEVAAFVAERKAVLHQE